jgi:hypothetical protein
MMQFFTRFASTGMTDVQTITVNGHIVASGNAPTAGPGIAAGKPLVTNGVTDLGTNPRSRQFTYNYSISPRGRKQIYPATSLPSFALTTTCRVSPSGVVSEVSPLSLKYVTKWWLMISCKSLYLNFSSSNSEFTTW